jgi:hypothetical protein
MTRIRAMLSRDEGVTIVELGIGMILSAMVGIALVTWMTSAIGAANHHRDDDHAVQGLREAHERITREVRVARALLEASEAHLVLWIDENWDDEQDQGEIVTWALGDGALTRTVSGAGEPLEVLTGVDVAASEFTFDSEPAEEARVVGILLVAEVGDRGSRSMSTVILLRNAG